MIADVTDDAFDAIVLGADGPVLVDFWAPWCGPCKMMAPALDALAKELEDRLSVVKMDVDDNPAAPARYGIRGVPTLLLFNEGEVVATKVGPAPQSQLRTFVEPYL